MNNAQAFSPWEISALSFPGHDVPAADKLRFLLGYAILAPSVHNAQPWLFRIHGDCLKLYADRTRALPVIDHDDRELTISCGAALFHLKAAARHFGYTPECELVPEPESPDLLARVRLGDRHPPTHEENTLFMAITRRRTNRRPFEKTPVEKVVLASLEGAAQEEGAWFHPVLDRRAKHALAELIAEGDRAQFADKRFRRELASWVHANRSDSHDGLPGYAHGFGALLTLGGSFILRTFDVGKGTAAKDKDLAEHSPLLGVIGTTGDAPLDWVKAGQAFAHVLLRATAANVSASYLNQPIEVDMLRPHVAKLTGQTGFPQMLVRMGYGPEVQPTPRRSVSEVLRA